MPYIWVNRRQLDNFILGPQRLKAHTYDRSRGSNTTIPKREKEGVADRTPKGVRIHWCNVDALTVQMTRPSRVCMPDIVLMNVFNETWNCVLKPCRCYPIDGICSHVCCVWWGPRVRATTTHNESVLLFMGVLLAAAWLATYCKR